MSVTVTVRISEYLQNITPSFGLDNTFCSSTWKILKKTSADSKQKTAFLKNLVHTT